jgi:leader peptidase (prepilin peptidase)/N-methyltransferase
VNSDSVLALWLGLAGLLVGSVVVFTAPRLVAHRVDPAPERPSLGALVPLVGPLWLGRWRPWSSLATQLLCGAALAGLALHYGRTARLPLACAYTVLLLAIAYIDVDHRLVLNRLTYPGIVLALAASLAWPGLGVLGSLEGAGLGLVLFGFLQVLGRGALGTGDTKLAVLIGAMRGWPSVVNALILGVILGGLAAVFFLVVLRRGRKHYMAYAPYLCAGAILSFFLTGS